MASTRTVTGADRRVWTVRRRWARGPRWRGAGREGGWGRGWLETFTLADASFIALALFVVLGLAIAVVVLVLLPLVVFVGELVLLALGAYALGRAWTVEAETAGPPAERHTWRVRGWGQARRTQREVAGQLVRGWTPRPAEAEPVP